MVSGETGNSDIWFGDRLIAFLFYLCLKSAVNLFFNFKTCKIVCDSPNKTWKIVFSS